MERNVSRRRFVAVGCAAAVGAVAMGARAVAAVAMGARAVGAAAVSAALPPAVDAFARRPRRRQPAPERQQAVQRRLQSTRLADHLMVVSTEASNVLVISGKGESVLIGSGTPGQSRELVNFIERDTGRSNTVTLINTHWHSAHTGANELLGKSGAKIIAHENTKLWMESDVFVEWEGRTYTPRPKAALPTLTTYDSGEITCGRERIRYAHLPQAHTDGDLYAFLPEANVLATGDLLHVGRYPVIDYSTHGWIGGYLEATEALLKVADSQTRIVPGEGPLQIRSALEEQLALCKAVKERLIDSFKQGNSLDEFIASAPTREFDASRGGDPVPFLTMAYRSSMGHLYDLIPGIV